LTDFFKKHNQVLDQINRERSTQSNRDTLRIPTPKEPVVSAPPQPKKEFLSSQESTNPFESPSASPVPQRKSYSETLSTEEDEDAEFELEEIIKVQRFARKWLKEKTRRRELKGDLYTVLTSKCNSGRS
jgi:hypothetical protein